MFQLYFSTKAQAHIQASFLKELPVAKEVDAKQAWYVHVFNLGRVKLLQVMHVESRLGVVVYDYRKANSENLDRFIGEQLSQTLDQLSLANPYKNKASMDCQRILKADRSIASHQSQQRFELECFWIENNRQVNQELIDAFNRCQLNLLRSKAGSKGYFYPGKRWQQLMESDQNAISE